MLNQEMGKNRNGNKIIEINNEKKRYESKLLIIIIRKNRNDFKFLENNNGKKFEEKNSNFINTNK